AVGSLRGIDVPVRRAEPRPHDIVHRLQRARHQRAAGSRSVKERLLVDLFGPVGMPDENDLDVTIAPLQEYVEQHIEALGEILHMLGHRTRDVHQAEHDGLRHRLRHRLETPVADVDRIDERNAAYLGLQGFDLGHEFGAARLVAAILKLRLERRQRLRPRPPQRDATRQGATYRSADGNVGGRAGRRVARTANALAFDLGQLSLGEIGQFQVVQEQVNKLVATENEAERIFTVALACTGALATARVRPRENIAFDELLVSRQHHVARAALATKLRLVHGIDGDADLAAFQDILDVPVLRRFLHRPLNQRLRATQKALAILETLATRIQAPVDNVNGHVSSASACLFYAHVPLDQP